LNETISALKFVRERGGGTEINLKKLDAS